MSLGIWLPITAKPKNSTDWPISTSSPGLPIAAGFFRQVEEALARPLPVAAVMIDLESFKDVNDTLGHAVGDYVLQEVARRLESSVKETGVAARIGGDEFAVLLYDVYRSAAGRCRFPTG